jgi:biogenesis of lysosome-related organelles complex 1 subunit 2
MAEEAVAQGESQQSVTDNEKEENPTIVMTEEQREACRLMFEKVSSYLGGELTASSEDYRLLLQLNQMTIAKYSDMLAMATRLNDSTKQLNEKYGSLQPYLDQVDMIDTSISALEQTAYQLDAYTKQLEQKFKSLEK